MKIRLRLSLKMLIFVLSATAIIYILAIGYISLKFKSTALDEAKKLTDSYVKESAFIIKASLDVDMNTSRAISQVMFEYDKLDYYESRELYNQLLLKVLEENDRYISVWDSWELQFIDSAWRKPHGRISTAYYRKNALIDITIDSLDLQDDNVISTYYKIKISGRETITDPYFYSYTKQKIDEILETSIVSPIIKNGHFVGIAGLDVSLEHFKKVIDTIVPFENSRTFLIANNGSFVAHKNRKYIGRTVVSVYPEFEEIAPVMENIKEGKPFSFIYKESQDDVESYISFAPIFIGKTKTPWSIAIVVPLKRIMDEANSHFFVSIRVGIIGLLILTIVIWFIALNIARPLRTTTESLKKLAQGDISESDKIEILSQDEIGLMADSVNKIIEGLTKTAEFANHIGSGNFEEDFEKLSEKDKLGTAILQMRDSLKTAFIEEQESKKNEKNLVWQSNGLNLFSKVIREDNNDIKKLSFNIISALVKYVEAGEGGIYLVKEISKDESVLELSAHIGFQREKYNKTELNFGESLVGRCAQEKEKIFLTEVPEDYIFISSGLGKEIPLSIILVPLIYNDELIGVLEIESLKIIEEHQISFIEKIAEITAATISSARINIKTTELLEQSQTQADELAQQEEEMRQNMEEMQATQEEAHKREGEMNGIIDALNTTLYVTYYDPNGAITNINDRMLDIMNQSRDKIIDKTHFSIIFEGDKSNERFNSFWSDLRSGKSKIVEEYYKKGKDVYWFEEKYTPIIDNEGKTIMVLKTSTDITSKFSLLREYELLIEDKKLAEAQNKARRKQEMLDKAKEDKKVSLIDLVDVSKFEIVNLNYINSIFKGDVDKIKNILSAYIKTIPKLTDDLFESYNSKQWDLLKSKANNFKTKMTYIGLENLQNIAKKIENVATEKTGLNELPELINQVEDLWTETEKELQNIIKVNA
jgi:PAS domain S-box-containing protein